MEQGNSGVVNLDTVALQGFVEGDVLPVADAADRFFFRGIGRIAVRQADAPGGEEGFNSLVPGFAIDVREVIVFHGELPERLPVTGLPYPEITVEHLFPGGAVDQGGFGHHPVEIENNSVKCVCAHISGRF